MDIRRFLKRPVDNHAEIAKKRKSEKSDDVFRESCENNMNTVSASCSSAILHHNSDNQEKMKKNNLNASQDLGDYLENDSLTRLSESKKFNFLTNPPNPSSSYNFKEDVVGGSKRCFRYDWFNQYPWLVYSINLKGALCLNCVLFKPTVKRGFQGAFITKVFSKYKDFHECAKNHAKSEWHKESVMKSKQFFDIISEKKVSVDIQINKASKELIENNRKKLYPIISSIIYCGTHDLALRGKNSNEGNFSDLLQFRIEAGDKFLENHLKTCSGKQKYTSHRIQNVIIEICGNLIRKEIIQKINSNTTCGFSLLADESCDISGIEQLSIGVRYLDKSLIPSKITEEFLGFVPLKELNAQYIALSILEFCKTSGLDMEKLVGIGFDGCATMSGKENGVQKFIRNEYPKALYFHCASHRLNLVVNDLNAVREIQNTIGTIKEVIKFFRESPLRKHLIPNVPMLSDTRWSSKYKSIRLFAESFAIIKKVLDDLPFNQEVNRSTRLKAQQLSSATSESYFIVCLMIISKYSAQLEPITNILQGISVDLFEVRKHVETLIMMFQKHRQEDLDEVFSKIYEKCKNAADELGTELKMPRIVGKQKHRANYQADSVKDYFKKSIYINYLDSLILSLTSRFSEKNTSAFLIYKLHPAYMMKLNKSDFENAINKIKDFYSIDNFYEEALCWYSNWANERNTTITEETPIIELLPQCQFYPAIEKVLEILLCLPPTTCTIERSFSTLRRVKTWLRSTMTENRLDGLCMMSIHRSIISNDKANFLEKVVREFAKEPRNLKFDF